MQTPFTTPGYRYAEEKIPGDGVTTQFNFSFAGGYIDKTHVHAFILDEDYVRTEIDWNNLVFLGPYQIKIPAAVPVGKTLIIKRVTPVNKPIIDYINGAILNERTLTVAEEQSVFAVAELYDWLADLLLRITALDGRLDVLEDRVTNIYNNITNIVKTVINNEFDNLVDRINIAITNINNKIGDLNDLGSKLSIATYIGIPLKYDNYEALRYITERKWKILPGSTVASLHTAPAADISLRVQKNGNNLGDINFTAGFTTGTMVIANADTFDVGDIMSVKIINGDDSASGLSVTISGERIW